MLQDETVRADAAAQPKPPEIAKPPAEAVERIVRMALAEDAPWGDITAQTFVAEEARLQAQLVAREAGVLCGSDVFTLAMHLAGDGSSKGDGSKGDGISVRFEVADGAHFAAGATLATVRGPARAILQAERVALNLVQRLCGIATLTAAYVRETEGTRARITDTRKTTPGLRVLERYAVRCGGGHNHRFSLSDAAMVKDNHLAALAAEDAAALTRALRDARSRLPHTVHFEVEVDRLSQIEPVLAAGVDTVLLDNFSLDDLRRGVRRVAGRARVEASGGVRLERIREIAATGVDLISVGALTHSARALDLGLDIGTRD